jgi:hypothetical protein
VGEKKISLDIDKGDGIVVGRRQSKKTMRRSLLPLERFRRRMSGSHFGHGVPAKEKNSEISFRLRKRALAPKRISGQFICPDTPITLN